MVLVSESQSVDRSGTETDEPRDRCGFVHGFDRGTVDCPAFQRVPFIAATSYGKPLGSHAACGHLQVGELHRNQFYPRCSLGADLERMQWVAMMGPGRVEVLRALNAEFETLHAGSLRKLVAAKSAALGADADDRAASAQLAKVVREFNADFTSFVNDRAARIEEIGLSPGDLSTRVGQVLAEWQRSARLDLPGFEERSVMRPEVVRPVIAEDVVVAPGLLITRAPEPLRLSIIGQIDQGNLDAVLPVLDDAVSAGVAVTIDVAALSFCSIAGLRALIKAVDSGNVELIGMPPHLSRALAAARLDGAGPTAQQSSGLEVAS